MYGYDAGARAACYAANNDTSIKDAAVTLGIMSSEQADRMLDPASLTDAERSPALVDEIFAEERERVRRVIGALSSNVRHAIFSVAGTVARADGEVSDQERQVLEVVGDALQFDGPETQAQRDTSIEIDTNGFSRDDCRLIYACGSWLASSDGVVHDSEVAILSGLRDTLGIDDAAAAAVDQDVRGLRGDRRQYLPRAEALPWWEDFDELLTRVLMSAGKARSAREPDDPIESA